MLTWPATLPQIALLDGWDLTASHRPPIVTAMEDGPDRMRPRSTGKWSQQAVAFLMTQDQFTTFYSFVETSLNQGTDRFLMPVWAPWRVTGLPARVVYLEGGEYKAPRNHLRHRVSFTLNILDW